MRGVTNILMNDAIPCYRHRESIICKQAQPLANELCPYGACWGDSMCCIFYCYSFYEVFFYCESIKNDGSKIILEKLYGLFYD